VYLVFGNGVMFHRDTWETSRMDPSIPISHYMGVDFHAGEWEARQAKWGKRIRIIFDAIRTLEAMQGASYKRPVVFPKSVVDQLAALAVDIEALAVLYSCFESWEVGQEPKGAKVQRCKGAGFVHPAYFSRNSKGARFLHLCTFAPLHLSALGHR
jgi:hypothetical protein